MTPHVGSFITNFIDRETLWRAGRPVRDKGQAVLFAGWVFREWPGGKLRVPGHCLDDGMGKPVDVLVVLAGNPSETR